MLQVNKSRTGNVVEGKIHNKPLETLDIQFTEIADEMDDNDNFIK